MIKAVLFDLDGTLLDSLSVWEKVDELFFENHHLPLTKDYQEALLHMRFSESAAYTISRYHLDMSEEEVMNEWHELSKKLYHQNVKMKAGAYDFIKALKKQGYKLAIVTSCHQELFEPCLRKYDVFEDFDVVVDANQVKMSKAQPDIYKHTISLLNCLESECLFIDDVYSSLKISKKLGLSIIAMNDPLSYDKQIESLNCPIIKDFMNLKTPI